VAAKRKKAGKDLDVDVRNTGIWLDALEDFQDEMSEWEAGFYASISDWFYGKGQKLTPGQYEHLEKLYRRFF
jgi:hypothetical protein